LVSLASANSGFDTLSEREVFVDAESLGIECLDGSLCLLGMSGDDQFPLVVLRGPSSTVDNKVLTFANTVGEGHTLCRLLVGTVSNRSIYEDSLSLGSTTFRSGWLLDNLGDHNSHGSELIQTLLSVNVPCTQLVNEEGHRSGMVFLDSDFRNAKPFRLVGVNHRSADLVKSLALVTNRRYEEELVVIIQRYPEESIVLFFVVDLSLGARCPGSRSITPVSVPLLLAPRVTNLNQFNGATGVKVDLLDRDQCKSMTIYETSSLHFLSSYVLIIHTSSRCTHDVLCLVCLLHVVP
jgi:hypothetical protein